MRHTTKNWLIISVIVLNFAFWSILLWRFSAEEIVQFIGVENGYFVMALVSVLGGVSSLGSVSYFATLVTLANGGLHPLLLGLASGVGISIGDSIYFLLGRYGRVYVGEGKIGRLMQRFARWLDAKPEWLVSLVVYSYAAFSPFPNDILAVAMGLSGRRYVPIIIAMVLGNITLTTLVATFSQSLNL